jgi:hypothetical protein
MENSIIRYMILDGEVWIHLKNDEIRKAEGREISRIIDRDPEFGLHFTTQVEMDTPKMRSRTIPLAGLELPN